MTIEALEDLSNSKLSYRVDRIPFEDGYIEAKTEFDKGSYVLDHPAIIEAMRRWDRMPREYRQGNDRLNPYLSAVATSLTVRLFNFLQENK